MLITCAPTDNYHVLQTLLHYLLYGYVIYGSPIITCTVGMCMYILDCVVRVGLVFYGGPGVGLRGIGPPCVLVRGSSHLRG